MSDGAWFVVYDEQPSKDDPYRSDGSVVAVIGRHPVDWALNNPNKNGITWLRFFAEIPLEVALRWPNYEDYRGREDG